MEEGNYLKQIGQGCWRMSLVGAQFGRWRLDLQEEIVVNWVGVFYRFRIWEGP